LDPRRLRGWAIFCMAVWLSGTVGMAVVATVNFYTIDPLIQAQAHPTFVADIEKLGHDGTRALLYYFSSELNRLYFQYWNLAQLVVGILALWIITRIPGAERAKWEVVAMLAIVLFLTVIITPRIVSVGRSIDFVSRVPPPDGLRTFGLLHAAYTVFDGVLLILGILVTLSLQKLKD
jgi:hypothetical protein